MNRFFYVVLSICIGVSIMPFFAGDYILNLLILFFIYASLAECWNLTGGYMGYASFGSSTYYGLGVYAFVLTFGAIGPHMAILIGGVISAVFSLGFGAISMRIRGMHFSIANLAVLLAFKHAFSGFTWLGASEGTTISLRSALGPIREMYYLGLALLACVLVLVRFMRSGRYGRILRAIHEDEVAVRVLGVNPLKYKVLTFFVSCLPMGVAGGLATYWLNFYSPSEAFSLQLSTLMVLASVLGGTWHYGGPAIGALIFVLFRQYLSFALPGIDLLIFGVILMVAVVLAPEGIVGKLAGLRVSSEPEVTNEDRSLKA